jgi:hypothetical protein
MPMPLFFLSLPPNADRAADPGVVKNKDKEPGGLIRKPGAPKKKKEKSDVPTYLLFLRFFLRFSGLILENPPGSPGQPSHATCGLNQPPGGLASSVFSFNRVFESPFSPRNAQRPKTHKTNTNPVPRGLFV